MVGYRKDNCSTCVVIYQCTNYRSTFLNWELALYGLSLYGDFSHVGLNTLRHPGGTIIIDRIASYPVKYEVISANSTFISAIVTMDPAQLNGTIISCNKITMTVSSSISSKVICAVIVK